MEYSKEFLEFIKDDHKIGGIIERNGVIITGNTATYFEVWEDKRSLIAKAINKDGTILDIGCANGFLLKCLMQWSEFELVPYGIDTDQERIDEAKEVVMTKYSKNFIHTGIDNSLNLAKFDFPPKFDFVYWNVWDDLMFDKDKGKEYLRKAMALVKTGGRLILGFYDRSECTRVRKVDQLKELKHRISGMQNAENQNTTVVWIDAKN